jgi:hypothetical protein
MKVTWTEVRWVCQQQTMYLSEWTVPSQKISPITTAALWPHLSAPILKSRSRTLCTSLGLCEQQYLLFCECISLCKWNQALSENKTRCGSISPSWTESNYKNSLITSIHFMHYCFIIYSFRNFVAVCADNFETPKSCARYPRYSCGVYKPRNNFIQFLFNEHSEFWFKYLFQ